MSLLGIDIGSSSAKGVVYDTSGNELARESRSYSPSRPCAGRVEMDALVFKDSVFDIIKTLNASVPHDPVEAICMASHGETFIPVDRNGVAVGPAILNSDNRAVEQKAWWEKTFGPERLYCTTGVPLHAMFSLNKILWLKEHEPQIFSDASMFLSVGDYLLMQLGLPAMTDFSLASRTMAFDIRKKDWSDIILTHCGLKKECFPPARIAGTLVGTISTSVSRKLGLKKNVRVALGGHDQPVGALGAGAIGNDDVFDSAGTYECLAIASDKPRNTAQGLKFSLNSYCHVLPDKYITLAFFPAGMTLSWFLDQFCGEEKKLADENGRSLFEVMKSYTEVACPGPSGIHVTPHLTGSCNPHWDVRATTVMAGFTPETTRFHVFKGLMEGLACELAINVCVLEHFSENITTILIAGGTAREDYFVQMRADITGKRFAVMNHEDTGCLGAAMLAGIAIGKFADVSEAVKKIVRVKKVFQPDKSRGESYGRQLDGYRVLYPALEPYRSF